MARRKNRSGVIAALDVGSTKVCCFIAKPDEEGRLHVEGIGHQLSDGMRAGAVADMAAVEQSVRAAIDAAERMAGETIDGVYMSVAAGKPQSHHLRVNVAVSGHAVSDRDIGQALAEAERECATLEDRILHALPMGYSLDGANNIRDPRGMIGNTLGVDLHVITASDAPVRNLEQCLSRGHLDVEGLVVAPYAAGLSCLVEDERHIGTTVIDMGGGTTSLAVFLDGALVYGHVIPVGGRHVTNDIVRGLVTSVESAERVKTLHGSALRSPSDDREMLTIQTVGDSDSERSQTLPRSILNGIIQPRIEEIFELVHHALVDSGLDGAGRRVVLTGGGSLLEGVPEVAARLLNKQVRLAKPTPIPGLADATVGPAFSACAGLLAYAAQDEQRLERIKPVRTGDVSHGPLARVGRWLRENF